jgi:dinuclear metal center YbgI/SA1388 family protein
MSTRKTRKPAKTSSKKISLREWVDRIESLTPKNAAESWDNVGLFVGDLNQLVGSVVAAIDLTEDVLKLARRKNADGIVLHHPPLFPKGRGLDRLVKGGKNDLSTLLLQCFEEGIFVYATHTNFDRCALDAMLDLSEAMGIFPESRLVPKPKHGESLFRKLVVTIPESAADEVRDALFSSGAGQIGNYDSCGFSLLGEGTFRGLPGSSPTIGISGESEIVSEARFETIYPIALERQVLNALRASHPYEEIAFDLYDVHQPAPPKGFVYGVGYGVVGECKVPTPAPEFLERTKKAFDVESLKMHGELPKKVRSIAFSPGKGSSMIGAAIAAKVDVFITGEVDYHEALDATRKGVVVIELGHPESEHYFPRTVAAWNRSWGISAHLLLAR